jgi:hypothetical protein
MKILKRILLIIICVIGLNIAVTAQKQDEKNPPKDQELNSNDQNNSKDNKNKDKKENKPKDDTRNNDNQVRKPQIVIFKEENY